MKSIYQTFYLLFLILVVASCSKENSDEFIPDGNTTGLDTNWVSSVSLSAPVTQLKSALYFNPKIDSCEVASNATLQFPEGLQVSIPANSFSQSNGQMVTGKVNVEALILRKKGDMIKLDRPTISNGRQLISAGNIFIRVKKNGEELFLAPGKKLNLRFNEAGNLNSVNAFKGEQVGIDKFNWIQVQDSFQYGLPGGSICEVSSSSTGWNGIQAYADTSGQRAALLVSLPANFTNANTAVYLVYKDFKSVLPVYGNSIDKRFLSNKLPAGKAVTVVVISKQGTNSFFLSHENITTGFATPALSNQVVLMRPQPTSLTDIKSFLETL